MLINILGFKRFQTDGKGNVILDLTSTSIDSSVHVADADMFVVTKQYEMRPDLISLAMYGTDDYVDYILKRNEISNPFSIKEGDVLIIPQRESFEKCLKTAEDEKEDDNLEIPEFVVQPKSATDTARLNVLKKKAENKVLLPPNINDSDENNIIITKDKILLGSSVTGICGNTDSRVKLKMSLQQKKNKL